MFPGPLCISLTPRRVADAFAADVAQADCVEVRLDHLEDPREADSVDWRRLPRPVIATCRREPCGGRFRGTPAAELRVLETAVRNGARYVDIDYRFATPVGEAPVIASLHDFAGTPPDLERVVEAVCRSAGAVAKIAVRTDTWRDVARVLGLLDREWPKPLIVVGMGPTGQITRVVGPSRGSRLTYASLGPVAAPGQLPVSELLETYRFRKIGRATRLTGIVGNPVGHSTSPALHNRAIEREGLDYVYLRLPVVSLEDFFSSAASIGIVGFSVTIPHKVGVLGFLDRVSPEAVDIGAVNTVSRADGRWVGENTDVHGVREALGGLDLRGMRVAVLGTGGAARAAVAALRAARSITLFSRTMEPGVLDWGPNVEVQRVDCYGAREVDLLINATPIGMSPAEDAVPVAGPLRAGVVFDMVYTPERTRLLREAEAQGSRTISGRIMFLAQAARQFEIWTGRAARPDVFSGAA